MKGYIAGYAFFVALSWGALALILMGELAEARWLQAFRSQLLAVARLAYVTPFGFIPIAVDVHALYPWAADAHALWRSPLAFILRAIVSFAIPIVVVALLDKNRGRRSGPLGALGLVALFIAETNGAIDWFMSLSPHFESTVFPAIVFASGMTSSLAVAALTAPKRAADDGADLATMLFAGLMFWGYVSYAQLIITWIGNIPREVGFYLDRVDGGFTPIAVILVAAALFASLFALLFRALKERPTLVALAGAWVIGGQLLDAIWWIGPSASALGFLIGLVIALAIGALFVALLLRRAQLAVRPR